MSLNSYIKEIDDLLFDFIKSNLFFDTILNEEKRINYVKSVDDSVVNVLCELAKPSYSLIYHGNLDTNAIIDIFQVYEKLSEEKSVEERRRILLENENLIINIVFPNLYVAARKRNQRIQQLRKIVNDLKSGANH